MCLQLPSNCCHPTAMPSNCNAAMNAGSIMEQATVEEMKSAINPGITINVNGGYYCEAGVGSDCATLSCPQFNDTFNSYVAMPCIHAWYSPCHAPSVHTPCRGGRQSCTKPVSWSVSLWPERMGAALLRQACHDAAAAATTTLLAL